VSLSTRQLMGIEPSQIEWHGNDSSLLERAICDGGRLFALRPPAEWVGHCELGGELDKESA
jgi:hypothetical protein